MRFSLRAWAALLASVTVSAQPIDIGPPPGRLVDVGGRKLHLNRQAVCLQLSLRK